MRWPPLKAWTCKSQTYALRHFVAINYGGELKDRWIIFVSVLDGRVSIKIPWSEFRDPTKWSEGWDEYDSFDKHHVLEKSASANNLYSNPSEDSGLSVPISKKSIRP